MSADWEVAPKDATHYFDGDRLYAAHWLKTGFYCVTGFENDGWREDHQPLPPSRCEERPKQPQSWSGPEDGLPPVGSVVEYGGEQVRVIAHTDNNGHPAAVSQRGETGHIIIALPKYYQPTRTPEQKAASARANQIREIMDAAGIDCLVTATRLVDAGFKR